MTAARNKMASMAVAGLMATIATQAVPAAAQPQRGNSPTPLDRFLSLPPDRQEALRSELQPLFFRSMQSNGRLNRMAQDCNMPLPPEATPAPKLEADLQSPQSSIGKLFGPNRQGALLARLRGALQTSIDCRLAGDLRPDMIRQLREFPQAFESALEQGLSNAGQGMAQGTVSSTPGVARPAPSGTAMQTAPLGAGAPAQLPRLMIGAPGKCELATAGHAQTCVSGLLYLQSKEGPVLLSVQSSPTVTIGFQGDLDSQVRPEHYTLQLNRMHTSVDGKTAAKTVTGTCEISMTPDGQIWQQATCRARDGNGMETVMSFVGNGRPVTTVHPDAEQQQRKPG